MLLQGLGCILAEDRKTVKSAFVGETGRLPVKLYRVPPPQVKCRSVTEPGSGNRRRAVPECHASFWECW